MIGHLSIVGPVGMRTGVLAAVCDAHVGHEHNYDHVTLVIRGRVRVSYSWVDGGKTITGPDKEFGQGEEVVIKAGVRHTLKALEANTVYKCIFSHRDFDGLVTQTYVGHEAAYV